MENDFDDDVLLQQFQVTPMAMEGELGHLVCLGACLSRSLLNVSWY